MTGPRVIFSDVKYKLHKLRSTQVILNLQYVVQFELHANTCTRVNCLLLRPTNSADALDFSDSCIYLRIILKERNTIFFH